MGERLCDTPEMVGRRLLQLRRALGYDDQAAFAKEIGATKSTYNPWEKGVRPLTLEGALKIRRRFRIPLEYLFFGDFADELPARIRDKIGRAA